MNDLAKSLPIIFFGVDRFPALPLKKLLEENYNVRAIFAAPDKDARGGKKIAPVAKVLGEQYDVPVYQPEKGREILPILEKITVSDWYQEAARAGIKPLGVLVSYGKIIPKEVLDWFAPMPILNIHPSLLPKYRGSSPVESAILSGDKKTGVSIIKLVSEMDAGEILAAQEVAIADDETSSSLYGKATEVGWKILQEVIQRIAEAARAAANTTSDEASKILVAATSGVPQDERLATFTGRFEKRDAGLLDSETAAELERKVRAFDENPQAFYVYNGTRMKVLSGKISEARLTSIDIHTSDGKFYSPTRIVPEGKKAMTVADYLNGQR
ncbi:MAG: methionyl-tRNA formyltransferase [Candidatus Nomurabacteria bacterium]|jgi:methionyl-tRNA formyltransferase|nr:methionyl-tRNA formyltransferase [Candidatus Nomurabacteria bacterium]